jgi:hypothetical protein
VKSGLVMPLAQALGLTVLLVIIKDTNVVYESWVQRHFIIDMSGTMVEMIRSVGGIFKPVKSLKECPPSLRGICGVFSPLAD